MMVISSTTLNDVAQSPRAAHLRPGAGRSRKSGDKTMNLFFRLGAPATAIAAAALFAALTTGSAAAGEFCRQDVTGHMTGCGFASMAQCQAASAGIGGDCFRDPWLASKESSTPANAYAYAPKAPHAGKAARKAGNAAQ
jgi:Protein of unknown function (DUF3551)